MGKILNELKYPSTIVGIIEIFKQIKDIDQTVTLNSNLINCFTNDPDTQQIFRDDNENLLSIKKEYLEALQHCPPELIRQAKGVK